MRTDQIAKNFLKFKKCKRKNDEVVICDGKSLWYYHHNLIAELTPNKILTIFGHWNTLSTNRRLNMISRKIRFYSRWSHLHCETSQKRVNIDGTFISFDMNKLE